MKKAGGGWRVNKRTMQIFDLEKFNLRNLKEAEGTEAYQIAVEKKFAALQNLIELMDINQSWENVTENIRISAVDSTGYCELQQHEPWFDEGFSVQLKQKYKRNCNRYRIRTE